MKKAVIAASVATMLSASAHADTILGLYIGGNVWDAQTSGSFSDSGAEYENFDFEDEKNSYYFAALEHPIPLIPNIKLARSELVSTGTGDVDFTFGGKSFNGDVKAKFDIDYIDYTAYYEVFDNGLFSFDFGITARDLDGDVTVSNDKIANLGVSAIIPMLYASTVVGLPFTGLGAYAEGNFLSFDDHTLYDYQIGLSYALIDNLAVDFDVTLGYRSVKLELEDLDDLYTDIEFSGLFLGAVIHF